MDDDFGIDSYIMENYKCIYLLGIVLISIAVILLSRQSPKSSVNEKKITASCDTISVNDNTKLIRYIIGKDTIYHAID